MTEGRIEDIRALLIEAKRAHGVYETTELNGVYDEDWPRWYAAYAVDHGIDALLGRPVATEELTAFLGRSYTEFERTVPKPSEPWDDHVARRIAAELQGPGSGSDVDGGQDRASLDQGRQPR